MIRWAVAGLVLASTACGSTATASGGTSPSAPASSRVSADALALRIVSFGGFAGLAPDGGRIPMVSVYADGRVITQGPEIAIYPGPALPNLRVRRIAVRDVDRLVARARTAGVGTPTDFGTPGIADAMSTRFTVNGPGGTRTTDVYALSETDAQTSGLTSRQRAARARMRALLDAITDLPRTLGAHAVRPDQSYRATAVAAIARTWTSTGTGIDSPVRAWPGTALPGQPFGNTTGLTCATSTGAAATRVLTAATSASTATPWSFHGQRWSILLRPLLPDEAGCADLK
jgi:hypothetical protein